MKQKIVVIEQDKRERKLIDGLLGQKYELFFAEDFFDGYSVTVSEDPDLVIIDPLYPSKEGLNLITEITDWNNTPIIALSGNGTEHAAVTTLTAGAVDFIRKPFFSSEFEKRVENALSLSLRLKTAFGTSLNETYKNGKLLLDFEKRLLLVEGTPIHLTRNEYKIFELLCKNAGKVLTYEYILKSVWGPRSGENTGILRVNIANLRKKLEKDPSSPEYLLTENGVGLKVAGSQSI